MSAAGDETLLEAYVAEALTRLDRGETVDTATLCAEHPELAGEVAAVLEMAKGAGTADSKRDRWLGAELSGRYHISELLGIGAVGRVYGAEDLVLQRPVAVKILHAGASARSVDEARLGRESRALAALDHLHILKVHDFGRTDDGSLFLVTERLRGASLKDVIDWSRQAMPLGPSAQGFGDSGFLASRLGERAQLEHSYLRQVVGWCADLAGGLGAAHARGIFHRDVKPSNAFVTETGRVVLLDFGLATSPGDASVTMTGSVVGTPLYMAPEQTRGRTEPDARIDVYSLGATLYHLLALRPGYEGDFPRMLVELIRRDPPSLRRLHPGLSADLLAIVEKAIERDPRRRYGSTGDLEADLRAFLAHRPVSVRPLGPIGRALRAVRRAPARTLALGSTVAAVALCLLALFVLHELQRVRDRRLYDELLPTVPALLALEHDPEKRMVAELAPERAAGLALLDRLLALDPDDLAARLLRSAARLDDGDHAGAVRDLEAIARGTDSPYLRAVAERFAHATDSRAAVAAASVEGLPEPRAGVDWFVAGFLALRARDTKRALELLDRAMDYLPARDFRLLALLGCGRYDEALGEASYLEGRHGETARTLHARAAALLGLKRYAEAVEVAHRAIALRPDRHGPWNNLGLALLRVGQLDEARAALERALDLDPLSDNTKASLGQLYRELGEWQKAEELAASVTVGWWRGYELGVIAEARAWAAEAAGDAEERARWAAAAVSHFTESLRHPGHAKAGSARVSIEIAKTLESGDREGLTIAFLATLRKDSLDHAQVMNLADLLRDRPLSEDEVFALRAYLYSLASALAPGDPRPQRYLDELLGGSEPATRPPETSQKR